jgi:hypothetical protein
MTNQAAQTMPLPEPRMRELNPYHGSGIDPYDGATHLQWYSADQMHQYARDYAAALSQPAGAPDVLFDGYAVYQGMTEEARARINARGVSDVLDSVVRLIRAEAPAASGGECQHEWTTVGRGGVPKRELACMKCGRHRDHMPAPNPPPGASVSERARNMLATEFDRDEVTAAAARRIRASNETPVESAALRALEQALTQQRALSSPRQEGEFVGTWQGNAVARGEPGGPVKWADGLTYSAIPDGTKLYTHPSTQSLFAARAEGAAAMRENMRGQMGSTAASTQALRELVQRWRHEGHRLNGGADKPFTHDPNSERAFGIIHCADELESLLTSPTTGADGESMMGRGG